MLLPIPPQAGGRPTTAITWLRDRVPHASIGQPAGVAPVQAFLRGRVELLRGGQAGVLVLAGASGSKEGQMVASVLRVVGKHDPWRADNSPVEHQASFSLSHTHTHTPRSFSSTVTLSSSSPSMTSQRYRPASLTCSPSITRERSPGTERRKRTRPRKLP